MSVCLNCLKTKLAGDYGQFGERALVIEPAENLLCYVFQPSSKWKDCGLMDEAGRLLACMQDSCNHCGAKANFLWLTSSGLRPENLDELFAEGVSQTLLRCGKSSPHPVCGGCCVKDDEALATLSAKVRPMFLPMAPDELWTDRNKFWATWLWYLWRLRLGYAPSPPPSKTLRATCARAPSCTIPSLALTCRAFKI